MTNVLYTVASGDLRQEANVTCWPTQAKLEADFAAAVESLGWSVQRGHPVGEHGFIDSQRAGIEVFKALPPEAPLVVVEAVWQYSHHVLPGLRTHRGPILLVGNWSGEFPGLVGMLNLTASLTKAGVPHSLLWSEDFTDDWAREGLKRWLETGGLRHDTSHVRDFDPGDGDDAELGRRLAAELQREKAIIGVFRRGLHGDVQRDRRRRAAQPARDLQGAALAERAGRRDGARLRCGGAGGALVAGRRRDDVPHRHRRGDRAHRRAAAQPVQDVRRRAAHGRRLRPRRGRDPVPAGAEGRPARQRPRRGPAQRRRAPARAQPRRSRELYAGVPLPHFNEVDEGAAVDALVTNRVWTAMGLDPATTLHDVRWGADYDGRFVWVFEISGSVPASHNGGYDKSWSMRQPPMYFPLGGGTLSGVSKPGAVVWSRVFIMDGALHVDLGRATALALPEEETRRRLEATTPQWPIMHAVLHGVTRDQFMARHKANHLQVAYAPRDETADRALHAKAAMFAALGVGVHLCGI